MPRARALSHGLTVGDLFCGAGGFSEGFEQAGFKIKWGLDSWGPARTTFAKNHRDAKPLEGDVLELDPHTLDPVSILVGSPPCTHFSLANRGGSGDREVGLRLVEKFLECVEVLEPDYWVMENVPSLRQDLEDEIEGDVVTVNSTSIKVPRRVVLNAADYGAPQARKRLFSGDFPLPTRTHGDGHRSPLTLAHVLATLPDPTRDSGDPSTLTDDPVYPGHKVRQVDLRDHFEDTRWKLTREEQALTRERKIHDRIYGEMSYPDDVDRPSRTITATRTHGSRMTIVVPFGERGVGRRTLTVRECASIQGFPLWYQFWAKSFGNKDVLVGNAVSPPVAFAIAQAIREEVGLETVTTQVIDRPDEIPDALPVWKPSAPRYSPRRRFREGVEIDWAKFHRLELENRFPEPREAAQSSPPRTEWEAHVYLGYAKRYRNYRIDLPTALRLARTMVNGAFIGVSVDNIQSLALPILKRCTNGGFTDGTELQQRWSGYLKTGMDPLSVREWIAEEVSKAFPQDQWKGVKVPRSATQHILMPMLTAKGKGKERGQPMDMSVRLAASAIALAIACERLNHGPGALARARESLLSVARNPSRSQG